MMSDVRSRRRILIMGYGREGKAALSYLSQQYTDDEFYIFDDAPIKIESKYSTAHILDRYKSISEIAASTKFDLVVKSPGISLYREDVQKLISMDIPVTSGTDIWLSTHGSDGTIGVTGTKGKSTTSSLIAFILNSLGFDVMLLGNLGVPLIDQPKGDDFTVLELSSYQVAAMSCGVDVAVFTNLYEEHIPWHGSVEKYWNDKLRLAKISENTRIVYNGEDSMLRERFKDDKKSSSANYASIELVGDAVLYKGKKIGKNFFVRGKHNLLNLALAITAIEVATGRVMSDELVDFGSFRGLPHRLEEHLLENGAIAVDDSIATIPEATISALSVYEGRGIHLFLGGHDRGVSLSSIVKVLSEVELRSLVLTGPVGAKIFDQLPASLKRSAVLSRTLISGVEKVFPKVKSGEILLLSPSATSFDEFIDYAERGNTFVATCKKLASRELERVNQDGRD